MTDFKSLNIPRLIRFFFVEFFERLNLSSNSVPPATPLINQTCPTGFKLPLMNPRLIINKAIILSIFGIAGFLLARSLYYGSLIGIILALIGIAAWTLFLYKLSNLQSEPGQAEETSGDY